ncbi:MAG: VWA domain-containing protein [Candidatus Saccharimonadales bacterium]
MTWWNRRKTVPEATPVFATAQPMPCKTMVTGPMQIRRSVQYGYDTGKPAVDLSKHAPETVQLVKGPYYAAQAALKAVGLFGVRIKIIVMVDGSGSMKGAYAEQDVQKMLNRALGFALNLDPSKSISVFTYGTSVSRPVLIELSNYSSAGTLIKPDFGCTNMALGFEQALDIARNSEIRLPTMVINITDGDPNDGVSKIMAQKAMTRSVVSSSCEPIQVKNLAVKSVPYLETIDDLQSWYEVRKDNSGNTVHDHEGHVILDYNPKGVRLIDNVDSQKVSPGDSDQRWAEAFAGEVRDWLDASAQVGLITGVPGIDRRY